MAAALDYEEDRWLDTATDGAWEQVAVRSGSKACGVFPYVKERRYGTVWLTMPPYTRTLGPRFVGPEAKPVTQIDTFRAIASEMIDHLPDFDPFRQVVLIPETGPIGAQVFQAL